MKNAINIGSRREVFWDDYLIDTEKTTTKARVCPVGEPEVAFYQDKPWDIINTGYTTVCKCPEGYKMYYYAYRSKRRPDGRFYMYECVMESKDGVEWVRPNIGKYEFDGDCNNNIVMDFISDNFNCFYDESPDCLPEERYKGVGSGRFINDTYGLYLYTSPDGYDWKISRMITDRGSFDTLNVLFRKDGKYYCYVRDYHERLQQAEANNSIDMSLQTPATDNYTDLVRGVRVLYSEDCVNWTEPKMLSFDDGLDYPLYTNNVEVYDRAPHIFIGFPTRYIERRMWTENYDQLGNYKTRWAEYNGNSPREGLSLTDAIFMMSRDGEMWHRYNEAFITPGYEHDNNWVYGDCYPAHHIIDSGKEYYYIYDVGFHHNFSPDVPLPVYRYKVRKDGFACHEAGGEERVLVTKPIIFDGNELHLNFETSAYGYIIIDVLDEDGNKLSEGESFEVFGNNIDRRVMFEDGSGFAPFAGKPVRLRFRMRDAKIYSMKFEG